MLQNNPLLAQLKQQMRESLPTKEGVVRATSKSFGFLDISDKESVFIAPPQMKKVLHGDRISAVISTENDKSQAEPQTLLETNSARFVAQIRRQKNKLHVLSEHPLMRDPIKAIAASEVDEKTLQDGDWVSAHISKHALRDEQFQATITELVAKHDDPQAPWWVVLARHNLPKAAPDTATEWQLHDQQARSDLTAVPFFTIDSESTRDMDDAISIRATATGWELLVAIADPDAYIAVDSSLDQTAQQRAFTTYLPGRNIPMLPRELADELCSLQPAQKRPALCAYLTINHDGTLLTDSRFELAWVCSQARFNYNHVSDYLEQQGSWQPDNAVMVEQLQQLAAMSKARQLWRQQHAVVFQDKPDYRFELDAAGKVIAVYTEHRRIANVMVEEAMIAANLACGHFLATHAGFGLFNVHSGFDQTKITALAELLEKHQAPITIEQLSSLDGYCQLRRWLQQQPTPYLENRIRRFQSYAAITALPGEHFGMGVSNYATWTSPIRKYSDLLNQRLLKAVLAGQAPASINAALPQYLAEQRKTQRKAERDIAEWLYRILLAPYAGTEQHFTAEIFDITRAGIRVRLLENGATAFMPLSVLNATQNDAANAITLNQDEGRAYQAEQPLYELGQQLKVNLHEVNDNSGIITKPVSTTTNDSATPH